MVVMGPKRSSMVEKREVEAEEGVVEAAVGEEDADAVLLGGAVCVH